MFVTPRMLSHFSRLVLIRTILLILLGMGGIPLFASAASPISTTLQSNKIFGPTQGLVGYWTFNGPDTNWTTGTVIDRSGQGNNGTMVGMATRTSPVIGKLGQGMQFFPSPVVDYVNAGSPAVLDNMAALSLSLWVRSPTRNTTPSGIVIQKSNTGSPISLGWRLEFTSGRPDFSVGYSLTRLRAITSSAVSRNQWNHIVVTWNGGALQSDVSIYVNGQLATLGSGFDGDSTRNDDNAREVTIGGMVNQSFYHFNSIVDDVRIYNRILSATEIQKLYHAGQVVIKANGTATTTLSGFVCGKSTVKDADGNVYNTLKIRNQCWMKQNMRVGTRINASSDQSNNGIIEKYCYNNTASNCTTNHPNQPDGGLYQWNEAMQYSTTPGARGICPQGWHIPTHDEWTTLERAVCTSGSCATDFPYNTTTTGLRGTNEGTKIKSSGVSGWEGNLAGFRYFDGSSYNLRSSLGYFWSSSVSGGSALVRGLDAGNSVIDRDVLVKTYGFSVRCLKN